MATQNNSGVVADGKFGTFGGVFTPNVLTILGVIMFLRFGQITGQAGIINTILILLLAKTITTLTAVSLAAIATNTRVKGGGAYYAISRSLGVEYGGGIAFVFYLAQAVSVAMYVIGFAEACAFAFPDLPLDQRGIASIANLLVFGTVIVGASWAIRVQYGILAILLLAILSFGLGAGEQFSFERVSENLGAGYTTGQGFLMMFALFFPAATGIMAGANMSGDLRDPGQSLPVGTFAAIFFTAFIYFGLIFMLGGSVDRSELIDNSFVMRDVALWPSLIIAGVFAATLSSALGSMMGAPRILQAFARDNVFPRLRFLGKGSGPTSEPRRAIVLTAVVSQIAIMLGDLNAIAPIITMFFMVTYGALNLACFYELYSRNPSFRPRFRFAHWGLALAGTVGCAVAMLLIDPLAAVVSILLMALLYALIRRAGIEARWGDVHSGVAFESARKALLRLESEPIHAKNWRPIVLALMGSSRGRPRLAEYGYWLTAGHGVLSLGQIISGKVYDRLEHQNRAERLLRQFIAEEGLAAFPAVVVDDDLLGGVKALLQCHGIGGIRPNTVLLGWSDDPSELERFTDILRLSSRLQRNIVVFKPAEDGREADEGPPDGEIHVWWHGRHNAPLMLILAHLLLQNPEFRRRKVRLMYVVPDEAARAQAHEHLVSVARRARLNIDPMIIVTDNLREALLNISRKAAMVMHGFTVPEPGAHIEFFQDIEVLSEGMPDTLLVNSSGKVDLDA